MFLWFLVPPCFLQMHFLRGTKPLSRMSAQFAPPAKVGAERSQEQARRCLWSQDPAQRPLRVLLEVWWSHVCGLHPHQLLARSSGQLSALTRSPPRATACLLSQWLSFKGGFLPVTEQRGVFVSAPIFLTRKEKDLGRIVGRAQLSCWASLSSIPCLSAAAHPQLHTAFPCPHARKKWRTAAKHVPMNPSY